MKKYKDFKEYMEDVFYNDIADKLGPYIVKHKDSFENDEFYTITWIDQEDISYHVIGVTFKDLGNNWIEIRTSVDADVPFHGKTRNGQDSDSTTKTYNVFFKGLLENGLHQVSVTSKCEYDRATYEKDRSLSQSLIPYIYEEDIEDHAEAFLKKHYPKALFQPMPLPVEEIAASMGMEIRYAPLGKTVFGMTYFGEERVNVYKSLVDKELVEITTRPGTMIINPDVYFMYNIGTANNTIIHECVHWDMHRRAFELQRLLLGDCDHISCEIVQQYDGIPEDSPALKWMEWQANQLAPRILMPAQQAKRRLEYLLASEHDTDRSKRFSIHLETAIDKLSMEFQVSNLAAKIRAIELGFVQAQGVQVYCDGKKLPPFSFHKDAITKDQTFVIDEKNLLFNLCIHPEIGELYAEGKLVYVNCMLCMNKPEYINISEDGELSMTEYALEHVDECCYAFARKYSASNKYSDTFYRRCFLCRDIDSGAFVESDYDDTVISNQSKAERKAEMKKISDFAATVASKFDCGLGGFANTLRAHMERKGYSNGDLSYNSNISENTISKYINDTDCQKKLENVIAIGKALNLNPAFMEDLISKAGYAIGTSRRDIILRHMIWTHPNDTIEEWQEMFDMAGMNIKLPMKEK